MQRTRAQYLAICQTCIKSKFNPKKGLICSLTNEHANFGDECASFEVEKKAVNRQIANQRREKEALLEEHSKGISTLTSNGKIIAGIVLILLGIIGTIASFKLLSRFFILLTTPFIFGIAALIWGINEKKQNRSKKTQNEILDDEL